MIELPEEELVEIVPKFGEFHKDGTLIIDFDPPEADVPLQWSLLWDETAMDKLTQYDKNRYLEQINAILLVDFIQNSDEASQSQFSNKLLEFTPAGIKIQISFGDPLLVSQGEEPDRVRVRLLKSFFTQA